MIDIDYFTDEQRKFLSMIVSDFHGPTMTGSVLRVLEQVIGELKPDWNMDPNFVSDTDLRADLEVCMAALQYSKIKDATSK